MPGINARWNSHVQPCFDRLICEGYEPKFVPNAKGTAFQVYGHGAMLIIGRELTLDELHEWTDKLTAPDRIRRAAQRLTDSIWTLEYRLHEKNAAEILSYSRDNTLGYRVFNELDLCQLQEKDGRIVTGIYIQPHQTNKGWGSKSWADPKRSMHYKVQNPQYIFSYS